MPSLSAGDPDVILEVLEDSDARATGAPHDLTVAERRYGGPLRFPDARGPYLIANFVSTIDGVVSLGIRDGTDASTISGHAAADRFVMALLRAAADVIVVGAHTLVDTPGHQWTAERLAPSFARDLRGYREALGRGGDQPAPLVVVSAHGHLPRHVALTRPMTPVHVLTRDPNPAVVRDFPEVTPLVVPGEGLIDGRTVLQALQRVFQPRLVLCEGGPTLMGSLVAAQQVAELFHTVAARLAGRDAFHQRPALVQGFAAEAGALQDYALVSVRRADSTLLLRYRRR